MNKEKYLPDNHRRSLTVTAKHVENGIREIEMILKNDSSNTKMSPIIKNLDKEERKNILQLLNQLKDENNKMICELELSSKELYEDRMVRGIISHLWVILSDSTAKGLRGYGKLSDAQAQMLGRYINSLLSTIQKIQNILDYREKN